MDSPSYTVPGWTELSSGYTCFLVNLRLPRNCTSYQASVSFRSLPGFRFWGCCSRQRWDTSALSSYLNSPVVPQYYSEGARFVNVGTVYQSSRSSRFLADGARSTNTNIMTRKERQLFSTSSRFVSIPSLCSARFFSSSAVIFTIALSFQNVL